MKKAFLLLAAVVTLMAAQAQERHIEPFWHGLYGVAGYDFSTNINTTAFSDKATFHNFYVVGGWQIRKESGIGLGVEFMKDPTGAFTQLPVFFEVRSHYLRSQLTPFTSLRVGYSIPLGSSSGGDNAIKIAKGGVMWQVWVSTTISNTKTERLALCQAISYEETFSVRRSVAVPWCFHGTAAAGHGGIEGAPACQHHQL